MKYFRLLLLGSLALAACGAPAAQTSAAPATPAGRTAALHEIVNDVQSRSSDSAALRPAADGDELPAGGQAQTGADSTVRLDLTEGTIVRLAPNSEFTLTELSPDVAAPATRLSLVAGQVFVILLGGSLAVETPVGSATVRGSYLGVAFDPPTNHLTATCLEGACELKNALGVTPLTTGQAAEIVGTGQPPSPPRPMGPNEFQAWNEISPEARQLAPEGTPGTPPGGGSGPQPFGTPPPSGAFGTPLPPPGTPPLGGSPYPAGTPGQPGPGPLPHVNTLPLSYSFTNNCIFIAPDGTTKTLTWSISISGPQSVSFDVGPGETRSGELPPGQYLIIDSDSEGHSHTSTIDSDFGPMNLTHCAQ